MKALIFDLDGTLVDTVYAHVFCWQCAFSEKGIQVEAWRIHRRVGMSGDIFIRALMNEINEKISETDAKYLKQRHGELFRELHPLRQPLPGVGKLMDLLRAQKIKHGIATSGEKEEIQPSLKALKIPANTVVVSSKKGTPPKPYPNLFLTCQKKLRVKTDECYAVGDSTWDILSARRAGMPGIALATGGYSKRELFDAGAYRVFDDALALMQALEELGFAVS